MDLKTIQSYDENTKDYLADWMSVTPAMLRKLIETWFSPGSSVLDVGSGSGRDVSWMRERGFDAAGVDASVGLLEAAREKNPGVSFRVDALPLLETIESESVDHILCSAVLMHLPAGEISLAVANLTRVVKPGGRVICSVRPSREANAREMDGRLYTEISLDYLAGLFEASGCVVLHKETSGSEKPDRTWRTVVARK